MFLNSICAICVEYTTSPPNVCHHIITFIATPSSTPSTISNTITIGMTIIHDRFTPPQAKVQSDVLYWPIAAFFLLPSVAWALATRRSHGNISTKRRQNGASTAEGENTNEKSAQIDSRKTLTSTCLWCARVCWCVFFVVVRVCVSQVDHILYTMLGKPTATSTKPISLQYIVNISISRYFITVERHVDTMTHSTL